MDSNLREMHFEFARKFEDKWALIFLAVVPIIEFLRLLIFYLISAQTLKKICDFLCVPMKKLNENLNFNHFGSDSMIGKKVKSFFCGCKQEQEGTAKDEFIEIKIESPSPPSTKEGNEFDLCSLNSYDLFKLISTFVMFVDHFGYFGLTQIFPNVIGPKQSRIFGRFAAPCFFFLAGFGSKKFRFRTWFGAAFIYVFATVIPLKLTHSPWESIMNILLINAIFYYLEPHKVKNPIIHIAVFYVLVKYKNYCSTVLNIGYGTLPFMLSIAGDLVKNKHFMAIFWVIGSCTIFALSSIELFAAAEIKLSESDITFIIGECILNALIMISFGFGIQEIKFLNYCAMTRFVRDGLKAVSRNGVIVYCSHLCVFKLIELTARNGSFSSMYTNADYGKESGSYSADEWSDSL